MSSGVPAVAVLTAEQIQELVRGAVEIALAERREDAAPALLLDRAGIARALGIGTSTLDKLRREGLPCIVLGDSPRFEAQECVAWLRGHRRPHTG